MRMDSHKQDVLAMLEQRATTAMERCGAEMERHAKQLAPVDTGRLRNSVTHEAEATNGVFTAIVGTNVEYGPAIELGTGKMSAQPYLKPAVTDHTDTYKNIIKDEMSK